MRTWGTAVVVAVLVAATAGCGGGAGEPVETAQAPPSPSQPEEPAATTEAAPAVECLPVPPERLASIATGEEDGVGMAPVAGAAVLSPDYGNVYFVAMRFSATGIEDQVGVWATNAVEEIGVTMAVDGTAQEFTMWPDADTIDAQITSTDPSVEAARGCLG